MQSDKDYSVSVSYTWVLISQVTEGKQAAIRPKATSGYAIARRSVGVTNSLI